MNPAFLCPYHRAVQESSASKSPHLTDEEIEERALVIYQQCRKCRGLEDVAREYLGHDMPYKGSAAHFENLRAAS